MVIQAPPVYNFGPGPQVSGVSASSSPLGPGWVDHSYESSGPWFLINQAMNYSYARVPIGAVSSMFVGLSAVDFGNVVGQTVLVIEGNATTAGVSSTDWLTCSGVDPHGAAASCIYQQPQIFGVDSVSVVDGVSYGTPADGTFGPGGFVYTVQPFELRRYLADDDEEWNEGLIGAYNFSAVMLSDMGDCIYTSEPPVQGHPGFLNAMETKARFWTIHSTLGLGNGREFCKRWAYDVDPSLTAQKAGGYSTAQDAQQDVQILTDNLGWAYRWGQLKAQNGIHLPPMPHYNPNRHQWTGV